MVISASTMVADSVKFIRDLISTNITDPLSPNRPANSKFLLTSYPSRPSKYPLITVKLIRQETIQRYSGSQNQLVLVNLEIRVWARAMKEKDELGDEVVDTLRTNQTAANGTVDERLFAFDFRVIGDVDEDGHGNPKSRIYEASYFVDTGG